MVPPSVRRPVSRRSIIFLIAKALLPFPSVEILQSSHTSWTLLLSTRQGKKKVLGLVFVGSTVFNALLTGALRFQNLLGY